LKHLKTLAANPMISNSPPQDTSRHTNRAIPTCRKYTVSRNILSEDQRRGTHNGTWQQVMQTMVDGVIPQVDMLLH